MHVREVCGVRVIAWSERRDRISLDRHSHRGVGHRHRSNTTESEVTKIWVKVRGFFCSEVSPVERDGEVCA